MYTSVRVCKVQTAPQVCGFKPFFFFFLFSFLRLTPANPPQPQTHVRETAQSDKARHFVSLQDLQSDGAMAKSAPEAQFKAFSWSSNRTKKEWGGRIPEPVPRRCW